MGDRHRDSAKDLWAKIRGYPVNRLCSARINMKPTKT
jgi:hypothetical protein